MFCAFDITLKEDNIATHSQKRKQRRFCITHSEKEIVDATLGMGGLRWDRRIRAMSCLQFFADHRCNFDAS